MARQMKPLVRGGGYYPSNGWTPLVYPGGYTTMDSVGGGDEPIEKTVSGSIVSFSDAIAAPVRSLSVAVEPIQDLHGYDNPWPAGGGVNIMDDAFSSSHTNEIVLTEGTYYAQAWLTQNPSKHTTNPALLLDGSWTNITPPYSGDGISIAGTSFGWLYNNATQTITVDAGKTFTIRYNCNDAAMQTRRLTFSKTQLSAFAPYSNICPISGWTGANVTRTGKNLCYKVLPHASTLVGENNRYSRIIETPGTSACFKCVEGQAYTVSGAVGANRGLVAYFGSDPDVGSESVYPNTATVATFSGGFRFTAEHTAYAVCYLANMELADVNIQIELGSTASDYQPYVGTTYSITFPTSAGTVYGGTLDVTTGKLTVDRAIVDMGTLSWTGNGFGDTKFFQTNEFDVKSSTTNAICSQYKYAAIATSNTAQGFNINGPRCRVRDAAYIDSTGAEFKAAMSGAQLVYELATPIVYDLTPTQIDTLLGTNNVWSDAGDVTVTYLADGNASDAEALGILLGGRYTPSDDVTDKEALDIILGGTK